MATWRGILWLSNDDDGIYGKLLIRVYANIKPA